MAIRNWLSNLLRGRGTILRFTAASTWLNVASMVSSIVVLRWIPPEELGLWQSFLLIQTYVLFAQGGVITGLGRELPYLLGKSQHNEALTLAAAAQATAQLVGLLLVTSLALAPILTSSADTTLAFCAVMITSAMNLYQIYLGYTYRGSKHFETLAKIQTVDGVLLPLSLPIVYFFGLKGLIVRYVLLVLTGTILRHGLRPLRSLPTPNMSAFIKLFKTGLPIFISEYLLSAVNTFPRLVLLQVSGVLAVGLYAPANAALGMMYMLPRTLSRYVLPQMSHRLGRTEDPKALWPMAMKSTLVFLGIGVVTLLIAWPLIPFVLEQWFPNYAASAQAARWSLVAGCFMGTGIAINALYTLKAWRNLMVYAGTNAVCSFVIPWFLSNRMDSLTGTTAGFAIAQSIACATALWQIHRSVNEQPKAADTFS